MQIPTFSDKGDPFCKDPDDLELFFPDPYGKGSNEISTRAKAVCEKNGGCPYKAECLAWALYNDEPGIWGGTNEHDRRRIKREAAKRPVNLGIPRPPAKTYASPFASSTLPTP